MANENTIKTRIQLKCDTEANWNKSALIADGGTKEEGNSFIPKKGEAIIYLADGTHPFSRLKVGDGIHSVPQLPFSGGGTAEKVNHTLTFGNGTYVYDGSADVTVPVYTGIIL